MKKFIVVESGKEIKLGDVVTLTFNKNTPCSTIEVEKTITVTEEVLMMLIASRLVKVIDTSSTDTKYSDLWDTALINLSEKTGWKLEKLGNILNTIDSVNTWAATQIVLKEIAIELDKKYEDHINKSDKIYAISPQDGRIHEIDKKTIKNYKAFPAFRNIEDAKIACSLIKDNLRSIFTNVK